MNTRVFQTSLSILIPVYHFYKLSTKRCRALGIEDQNTLKTIKQIRACRSILVRTIPMLSKQSSTLHGQKRIL